MRKITAYHLTLTGMALALAFLSGCHFDIDQEVDFDVLPAPITLDASLLQAMPDGEFAFDLEPNCELPGQFRELITDLRAAIESQDIDLGDLAPIPFLKPRIQLLSLRLTRMDLVALEDTSFEGLDAVQLVMGDSKAGKKITFESVGDIGTTIDLQLTDDVDWFEFFQSPDFECLDMSLIITGKAPEEGVTFMAHVYAAIKVRLHLI